MTMLSKRESTTPRRWFDRGPLAGLRSEMDELFQSFFGDSVLATAPNAMVPRLDLSETETAIEVKTDLPGVSSEEVEIEIRDNYLTISGEHSEEKTAEGDDDRKFHRIERRYGRFSRSVRLPCDVDEEKVDAELKNGVLTVVMPKAEAAKSRRISIKTPV